MESLADGAVIRGDGVTLHAVYTPGHASDHLCYYLEEERALFTGDLILGGSTTVIPPDDGDLGDYLASLRRVLQLDVQRIYPAHGPVLEPARPVIEGYIAHRLERDAQILAAVGAGAETVADIVARVYREVSPALHPVARLSVLSHLQKLERDGTGRPPARRPAPLPLRLTGPGPGAPAHPFRSASSTRADGHVTRRRRRSGVHAAQAPRETDGSGLRAPPGARWHRHCSVSRQEVAMRGGQRGVTLVEVVVVLLVLGILMGAAVPTVGAALEGYRAGGATADLYAAVHLTKARARALGVTHALVLEPDGRGFRIVADPGGDAQTVEGPHRLVDGAVATSNVTIQFSSKGFAVPAGTITIRSGGETRRIVVNLLGRARVAAGEDPT